MEHRVSPSSKRRDDGGERHGLLCFCAVVCGKKGERSDMNEGRKGSKRESAGEAIQRRIKFRGICTICSCRFILQNPAKGRLDFLQRPLFTKTKVSVPICCKAMMNPSDSSGSLSEVSSVLMQYLN